MVSECKESMLAFSQVKESSLTLSEITCESSAFWLKTQLFFCFQITQTQASHITLKKECNDLGNPARWLNWTKWSRIVAGATKDIDIHCKTKDHTRAKISHPRKMFRSLQWTTSSDTYVIEKNKYGLLSLLHLKVANIYIYNFNLYKKYI